MGCPAEVAPLHQCKSDWEIVELYTLWRSGWSVSSLGERYRMSHSDVRKMVQRVEDRARQMGFAL